MTNNSVHVVHTGVKTIVIDGLIASGKTTMLQILKQEFPDSVCICEPVEEWESSGELQKFYDSLSRPDSSICSYKFQTYTFISRIKKIKEVVAQNPNAKLFFLERSIFSDRNFFVEMLHDSGKMNDTDYKMYTDWWELWSEVMPLQISGFIYLNPDAEECMRRLKSRNRGEEVGVTIDYQINLKAYHDAFLNGNDGMVNLGDGTKVPCLNLQTNDDYRNEESRGVVIDKIRKFVSDLN